MNILTHWFSSPTTQEKDVNNNPWAGLASYEDPATAKRKLKFCGRDDESYDVTKLIMGNIFVTLYGKSGIGKTSLLNAGVFPELREKEEKQFHPICLRLGMREENGTKNYQAIIIDAIERCVQKVDTISVIKEQINPEAVDYLWNYFARHRFYDTNGIPTTPVIVFDQFEEVFRKHSDRIDAETLLRQLDYINDKDHTLDITEVDGIPYCYEQNFRFVVSIREDDLYRLEDSIDNCYLPALKRCRYRLRSLSEEGAKDVILIPGKGIFNPDEQKSIVQKIIGKSRNSNDQSINTNMLSLLCSRIFAENQHATPNSPISLSLVETFMNGNPIEQFYNEAISILPKKTRERLEMGLVTEDGRRKYMDERNYEHYVKNPLVRKHFLEGNYKIFQHTSISSDHSITGIELIHDSFCEAILSLRQKRHRRRFHFFAILFTLLLLTIAGESVYLLFLREKPRQWTIRLKEVDNIDNRRWSAQIRITAFHNDSTLVQKTLSLSDSTDFKDWVVETPAYIQSCRIHIELDDTSNFHSIKDSIIDFTKDNAPIVIFPVQGIIKKYYTLPVCAYINDEKGDITKQPLRNTFITFHTPNNIDGYQNYTDKNGICTFTELSTQPGMDCYITAMHEGFFLASKQIIQWKDGDTLAIGLSPNPLMQKEYATRIEERLMEIGARGQEKKLNYTQTLPIQYDNGSADDTIYIGAYVDTVYNETHEMVKGIYYYHKDYPKKYDWANVPSNKAHLLNGYVDRTQNEGNKIFSFFTGTDSLYNHQYFSGMIEGNTNWHGTITTPNRVGIKGQF